MFYSSFDLRSCNTTFQYQVQVKPIPQLKEISKSVINEKTYHEGLLVAAAFFCLFLANKVIFQPALPATPYATL